MQESHYSRMQSLKDRVAVITGASRGIGKAIALRLASQGMALRLVGRDPLALESVAAETGLKAAQVTTYLTDLAEDDEIAALGRDLQRDCGGIDVLVHSAGVFLQGFLEQAPVTVFDAHYRVNVRAPYLLTQTLLPLLRQKEGQVVFVNSSVVAATRAGISQYAATKYALRAVADSLRQEVNSDGIRVLTIYPGRTATPMQAAILRDEGRPCTTDLLMQPEDVADMMIAALTLPRTAEVTDIHMRPLKRI